MILVIFHLPKPGLFARHTGPGWFTMQSVELSWVAQELTRQVRRESAWRTAQIPATVLRRIKLSGNASVMTHLPNCMSNWIGLCIWIFGSTSQTLCVTWATFGWNQPKWSHNQGQPHVSLVIFIEWVYIQSFARGSPRVLLPVTGEIRSNNLWYMRLWFSSRNKYTMVPLY